MTKNEFNPQRHLHFYNVDAVELAPKGLFDSRNLAKTKPAVVEIVAMDEKGSPTTLGTGFFISSDDLVVTNFHVIKGATSIAAVNNNGAIFLFERVVGQPTGADIAILQFRATEIPFLTLVKSGTAFEGLKVIVIGNPKGIDLIQSQSRVHFLEGYYFIGGTHSEDEEQQWLEEGEQKWLIAQSTAEIQFVFSFAITAQMARTAYEQGYGNIMDRPQPEREAIYRQGSSTSRHG